MKGGYIGVGGIYQLADKKTYYEKFGMLFIVLKSFFTAMMSKTFHSH